MIATPLTLPPPQREPRKARRRRRTDAGRLERIKQIVLRIQRRGYLSEDARELAERVEHALRS